MTMNKVNSVLSIALLLALASVCSCKKTAGDVNEASQMLVKPKIWYITEIAVNDAVTFADGKTKQQFGGVDFGRHMETVQFKQKGVFSGLFKDNPNPMILRWRAVADHIVLGDVDSTSRAGEWTIMPRDVSEDTFVMKTQSIAYDFPRTTKIAMKFKTVP